MRRERDGTSASRADLIVVTVVVAAVAAAVWWINR